MLIRTQDKTELVNFNNVAKIILINDKRIVSVSKDGSWTTLGYYPEEKAMKVLDDIADQYNIIKYYERHTNTKEMASSVFQMPEVEA
jgi:hypothetical protein